jgi:hypothetical protein
VNAGERFLIAPLMMPSILALQSASWESVDSVLLRRRRLLVNEAIYLMHAKSMLRGSQYWKQAESLFDGLEKKGPY